MNKKNSIITLLIIILLAISAFGGFLVGVWSKGTNRPSIQQQQTAGTTLKTYTSKNLGLSFEYPSSLGSASEENNAIVLPGDTSEPWMYQISADPTKFTTVQDWLNAQPKGSASAAGINPILSIGTDTVLVEEYVVVDYNGSKPIYGKLLSAYIVRDGKLIKVSINRQIKVDSMPVVDPDALSIITSLK